MLSNVGVYSGAQLVSTVMHDGGGLDGHPAARLAIATSQSRIWRCWHTSGRTLRTLYSGSLGGPAVSRPTSAASHDDAQADSPAAQSTHEAQGAVASGAS